MTRALIALLVSVGCRVNFGERNDAPAGDTVVDDAQCTAIAGVLAHYPMNAGDITTGNVLRDRSGNAYDGSIIGSPAPALTAGHDGECLDFSATTEAYVDIGGLPLAGTSGAAVTIAFWFFRDTATASDDVIIDFPPPPARYDLWLINQRLCINTANGECWGVRDPGMFDRWVHVAAVMKNGPQADSYFYVDGARAVIACLSAPCDAIRTVRNPLRLGATNPYTWQGKLDEVRLYDRELTAQEVASLYNDAVCP